MTTVRHNLNNGATTQYSGFNFNSFAMFNGIPLAAGPDGVFQLECSNESKDIYTETTDERRINAFIEYPESQFGIPFVKKGRRLYIGGKFNGPISATIIAKGISKTSVSRLKNKNMTQQVAIVPLTHKSAGEYMTVIIENIKGSDFNIDFIDGIFVVVTRSRKI